MSRKKDVPDPKRYQHEVAVDLAGDGIPRCVKCGLTKARILLDQHPDFGKVVVKQFNCKGEIRR